MKRIYYCEYAQVKDIYHDEESLSIHSS